MNWKQEAIEKLNNLPAMVIAVDNIPAEIKRLEQEAVQLRGIQPDRLPHTTPDRGDTPMLNNIVKREELSQAYDRAKIWVDTTRRAFKVLTEEEQSILMGMYVNPSYGGVADLCKKLGLEQSTLYRKREEALYQFTLALYGATRQ